MTRNHVSSAETVLQPEDGKHVESRWVTHPWAEAGGGRPRFAVHGGPYADWQQFVNLVQRAESLGFDAYWKSDHPARSPGCWTTLAALAAVTRTIRLGTLVNCVVYRSPAEVARQAADVDRMSDGRVILGLGAGDDEQECRQLGISMPPARERVRLLGEMIQSVKGLWGEAYAPTTPAGGQPLNFGPVQSPRIPLLIAGLGRTTLRYVAAYADAVNFPPTSSAADVLAGVAVDLLAATDVEQKLGLLEKHCRDLARPPSSLVRSHMAPVLLAETPARIADKLNDLPERTQQLLRFGIVGTPEQAVQTYESLRVRGIDYFIAMILGNDTETMDLLAERVRPVVEKHATTAT
ncbi:MAG TPA: LLM class flavin-dependent oxidoreductase [Chloroflexota bacterium]|jgi:alkanesulfonate monooxygenase SsuD/methylene tetrahydromethanopterin reductase-like flavin-dependent oxidoreductase (luciferase family)